MPIYYRHSTKGVFMKLVLLVFFLFAAVTLADYRVVSTIDAPDTNISGLGFGDGSLWAVDGVTEYAYKIDPTSGTVQNSWYCANSSRVPTGLTYAGGTVYIIMATVAAQSDSYCYRYNSSGTYLGQFDLDC
jgi:hypothetical protein